LLWRTSQGADLSGCHTCRYGIDSALVAVVEPADGDHEEYESYRDRRDG